MNIIAINGHLVADPKVGSTKAGQPFANFTVAHNEYGKDAPIYAHISTFGTTAEFAGNHFKKGSSVEIYGAIDSIDVYTGKDGVARPNLNIKADRVGFYGTAKREGENTEAPKEKNSR